MSAEAASQRPSSPFIKFIKIKMYHQPFITAAMLNISYLMYLVPLMMWLNNLTSHYLTTRVVTVRCQKNYFLNINYHPYFPVENDIMSFMLSSLRH